MKTLSATEFKLRCLAILGYVSKNRKPVPITKRGKPIAKLVPADKLKADLIGRLEGVVFVTGDIKSPIETPEIWRSLH